MPQQQCPWCGHCGPRYQDGTPPAERPSAHSDGSTCVCRHVTADSPESAYEHGGRYYDHLAGRWICLAGCHPEAAAPVIRELDSVDRGHLARRKGVANASQVGREEVAS